MKHFLFILGLVISLNISAQHNNRIFEFENLNVDSLVVLTTYLKHTDTWKDIYIYKNGLKVKSKVLINDTLRFFNDYLYENENLIEMKKYSQNFFYDPDKGQKVAFINTEFYTGEEYNYENGLLTISKEYVFNKKAKDYTYEKIYQYYSLNQIEKEIHIDKPHKFKSDTSYKTYNYYSDSVVINYYRIGKFSGKEIYLENFENPKEVKSFSNSNELIEHVVYDRNESNLVKSQLYKLKADKKNVWGEYHNRHFHYDRVFIKYNEKQLPILMKYYTGAELIYTRTFEYYAP